MKKPVVLIIDDDVVCNMLSMRMLNKYVDVNLIAHESPKEALNYIINQKEQPDYILLDLLMPEMGGWEFLDRLKALTVSTGILSKIVILTSSIRKSDQKKALSFNCVVNYVNKPLGKNEVLQIFEEYLLKES